MRVNYPEVAALYFWLPDSAQGTLQKRTKTLPELKPPWVTSVESFKV
jgi:hypothetical protein